MGFEAQKRGPDIMMLWMERPTYNSMPCHLNSRRVASYTHRWAWAGPQQLIVFFFFFFWASSFFLNGSHGELQLGLV